MFGTVGSGPVRSGGAGAARSCGLRYGEAGYGLAGQAGSGLVRSGGLAFGGAGQAWHCKVRYVWERLGRLGKSGCV